MHRFLLLFSLTFIAISCGPSRVEKAQLAEVKALQTETEHIHDEAMKDLAAMNRHKRALKASLETLSDKEQIQKQAISDTLAQMQQAETDMYDWMRNYSAPTPETDYNTAKTYLEAQRAKIKKNAEHIHLLL